MTTKMPDFFAGLGTSLVGSAINIGANAALMPLQSYYWRKNLDYSVAAQKKLFDYQNAYNTPSAQMERLTAAGLNPNLVYGSSSPGGVSGNVPAASPGSEPSASFNTADLSSIILQMSEAKAQDASAQRNVAEANYLNKQSGRYDELVDMQLRKDAKGIEEVNSRLSLNASQFALNNANSYLSGVQASYVSGQIQLQQYEREKLVAETLLFQVKKNTEDYLSLSAKADAAVKTLEARFEELFYSGDRLKEMSEAEYRATKEEWDKSAAIAAADASIEGNKVGRWISYIFDKIEVLASAGNKVSSARRNWKK